MRDFRTSALLIILASLFHFSATQTLAIICPSFPVDVSTESEFVDAVSCANGNATRDIINVTADITFTTINNSTYNPLPLITSEIIINGNGHTLSTATNPLRHFSVWSTGSLILYDINLTNGNATIGGSILNKGLLIVFNTIISGNEATNYGGGISNGSFDGGGTLYLYNSIVSGNKSANNGAGIDSNLATMIIGNSTIVGNDGGSNGGGIFSNDTMSISNSVIWGNCDAQFVSLGGTWAVEYTAIQGTDLGVGTNINLAPSDDVFIAPSACGNAPTTAGDYHLHYQSPVIDAGLNGLLPADSADLDGDLDTSEAIPYDFEGDERIIGGDVDMGADEISFPLPPQNANLIYNSGFSQGADGDAGWRFYGSLKHQVINGRMKLNFPTTVNGWMRQFRTQFPLQPGLRMVGYVTVSNQDSVAKDFQIMFRDSDLSNNYLCNFSIPGNTWNKVYYMRFIPQTNWEIIRVDIRPNLSDANGLRFDNVNLRYRPWLTFTDILECISPTFSDETPTPPDTELVQNDPVGNGLAHSDDTPTTVEASLNPTVCQSLDWFNTDNWNGYLPTSEVQFVFDPFPDSLLVGNGLAHSDDTSITVEASLNPTDANEGSIFDANGDGVADTLYDALSYSGHGHAESLLREAVIAMLNDRYDPTHPESWWAVEIDTAEALAQGENAMLALAQRYAMSNSRCE